MKKLLGVLVFVLLALALAACSNASSGGPLSGSSAVPEVPPIDPATLTGLPKDDDYPEGRRLTAVMVNNIGAARPTSGLSDAEMLVEIKVEGGITRFMALYSDYEKIPKVGTFRSARDQFFQLILPFQALYAHVGESSMMNQYFKDYGYKDFNLDGNYWGEMWWRDQDRLNRGMSLEYTSYTDGEHIADAIKKYKLDDEREYGSCFFDFVPYDQEARTLSGDEVTDINVRHSSAGYRTMFEYDKSSGKYWMSQYNPDRRTVEDTIDENNKEQLAFENVLVIFAPMNVYYATEGVMQVHYEKGGFGYYFNGGRYELVRWIKGIPLEVLRIVDADGNETSVQLNPGKTYVAIVDDAEQEKFHNDLMEQITNPVASSSTSGSLSFDNKKSRYV